jgi:deferrochelatase/peroxidase EfeB
MALDYPDIQANILRGYRSNHARHTAISIPNSIAGGAFLSAITGGAAPLVPQVSTAAPWTTKPDYCMNLAVTAPGLAALGVTAATLAAFPAAFTAGSAARSMLFGPDPNDVGIGDVGSSSPDTWAVGGSSSPIVHLVVSLYTMNNTRLEELSASLSQAASAQGLTELYVHDATALPDGAVHFGYRDGIAQPWIEGTSGTRLSDLQPEVPTGDFLLGCGYQNHYSGGNFLGGIPAVLGDNGTYSCFRVLEQDVTSFEKFLDATASRWRIARTIGSAPDPDYGREYVAAKLMGRWRNGTPLTLRPDGPEDAVVPDSSLNDYDFAPTLDHPTYYDDNIGLRCPIGAHTRRLNPRGALVMGQPHSRRIIRRGMPYGPAFDPKNPDSAERGLVGHFVCGDLESQFEFIMRTWVNQDLSTSGLRGTRDPILGAQLDQGGRFVIRTSDTKDPIIIDDLPRLVRTRGSLYCFFPGLNALRHLATSANGNAKETS